MRYLIAYPIENCAHFSEFNKYTECFICSQIGKNNGQHVKFTQFESERQITVTEMKCARAENVSIGTDTPTVVFVLFGALRARVRHFIVSLFSFNLVGTCYC